MGGTVGVLLITRHKPCLFQRTIDKTIFRIHDGSLRVCQCLLIDTRCRLVTLHQNGLAPLSRFLMDEPHDIGVVFQELQGNITGGIAGMDGCVWLQELLDMTYAVFYLVTIVDMDMAGCRIHTLIDLYDGAEQLLHPFPILKRGRYHRRTEERRQHLQVNGVTATLKLIIHIQGTYDGEVHVKQLCRQIEVALDIRRVNHVDNHIGSLLCEVLTHIKLFW